MVNRASRASRLTGRVGSPAFRARRVSTRPVASTSTHTVASGISRRERDSLSATARRAPRSGIRRSPVPVSPCRVSARCCDRAVAALASASTTAGCRRVVSLGDGLTDVPPAHHAVGPGPGESSQIQPGVPGLLAGKRGDNRHPSRPLGSGEARRRRRRRRCARGAARCWMQRSRSIRRRCPPRPGADRGASAPAPPSSRTRSERCRLLPRPRRPRRQPVPAQARRRQAHGTHPPHQNPEPRSPAANRSPASSVTVISGCPTERTLPGVACSAATTPA